ncbi:MAG: biotin--[acetyl-CoA-carboxylase] ligase [Sphingobacteriia bacterium]|nr:biotin--[acetyl-CoA-carboxylase] ligase [Sphingobacteriia bacterium]
MASVQSNGTIGHPFIQLASVDSTNNYAHERLHAKMAAHGYSVFAEEQFAGRGQRGKIWKAEPGSNIILSVILDTTFIPLRNQFYVGIAAALAGFELFSTYTTDDTKIKWPNDIYWQNRKAGGILVETTTMGQQRFSIAGFGININQTAFPDIGRPVSLKQITGKSFTPSVLAKELCSYLEKRYLQLKQGAFDSLLKEYNSVLFRKGEVTKLKKNNIAFECIVEHVNNNGELVVTNGVQQCFSFGEVEWII